MHHHNGFSDQSPLGIMVLGMHRSGTSALTGVLSELGVTAAGELHEAQSYNKKGIFENKAVHSFHERVLAHFGSRWDDPMPLDLAWVESPAGIGFVSELEAIIETELLAESPLFTVKDPRMCRLVPLWRKAMANAGVELRAVIPLRHPLEVAASLRSRDEFPRAKSFLLWLEYMLSAERETRGIARSFISYDELMQNWRGAMMKVADDLAVKLPKEIARAERGIDDFLTTSLRHHVHSGEIGATTRLDRMVDCAWKAIQKLSVNEADQEALSQLDALAAELKQGADLYGPYIAWEFAELNQAKTELAEARGMFAASEEQVRAVRGEAERQYNELRSQFDRAVGTLRTEIDRLFRESALINEQRFQAEARLTAIETSSTWRATRSLRNLLDNRPGLRRGLRRSAKLAWWTVTLQLPSRYKQWQARYSSPGGSQRQLSIDAPALREPLPSRRFPEMLELRAFKPTARIAAVVHLFYVDMWPELCAELRNIPEKIDVIISVCTDLTDAERRMIYADFPNAQIVQFENRGRDILPLMALANAGLLSRYELICKIHAKRSPHRVDGDTWRRQLLRGILGEEALVSRILAAFDCNPDLGIVVADGQIFGSAREHWENNEDRVLALGARIGLETIPNRAAFAGGSIYWIRPFIFDTLNGLKLTPDDFEEEPIPADGTTAHAIERLISLVAADAGLTIAESGSLPDHPALPASVTPKPRVIAYYLPQFHPTPENDRWWGKGFTEWTNVSRALPMFKHHRQPRLPADLGFYDLRLAEAREAQAALAEQYGIDGFCYYYYWFDGEGVLRLPLDAMLKSGSPKLPFMICWANEPWSRNWDGGNRELLMPQNYREGWAKQFARDIAPLMRDERYIRSSGLPLLMIYRVMHIPGRREALIELRSELRQLGIGEVHIIANWVHFAGDEEPPADPTLVGIDSWAEFPPHRRPAAEIGGETLMRDPAFAGNIYSYRSAVDSALAEIRLGVGADRHRGVMMGWDNTARRLLNAHAFYGATPALFRRWLREVVREQEKVKLGRERLVFVNAWNEWAEGTYLEPDRDFGHGWLAAVASASGRTVENRE